MPYQDQNASKVGHIDILRYLEREELEHLQAPIVTPDTALQFIQAVPAGVFTNVCAVDSGPVTAASDVPPYSTLEIINSVSLDLKVKSLVDSNSPLDSPTSLLKYINDSMTRTVCVIPTRNLIEPGMSYQETFRKKIYSFFINNPILIDTLQWLLFSDNKTVKVNCPYCGEAHKILSRKISCAGCGEPIYITDFLGFHEELSDTSARQTATNSVMKHVEILLLFAKVKQLWEQDQDELHNYLFISDGPLYFAAPFNKLIPSIRKFLTYASGIGIPINLVGIEKTGMFVSYFDMIKSNVSPLSFSLLNDYFIRSEIQQMHRWEHPYGLNTHFGSKLFFKVDEKNQFVINVAIGRVIEEPEKGDFAYFDRILNTILVLKSNRYPSGIIPVELAHNYASISKYPGSTVLSRVTKEYLGWT